MRRPLWAYSVGLLLALGTAGCSGGTEPDSASESSSPATTSAATASSASPSASPELPPPGPPVVGPGPCPYLDEVYVEETVGQRMDRVETVTVAGQPAPDCVFYRPDDAAAVTIDLTPYPDAVSAQNAALAAVTAAAIPITDLGDYGGVIVSPGQTLLALTSGSLLLVVTTNQETSLQARELAGTVLAALPPG